MGSEVNGFNVEAFGAAIFHVSGLIISLKLRRKKDSNIPSKSVFSCKEPTAVVTSMVPLLHVNTLVVTL